MGHLRALVGLLAAGLVCAALAVPAMAREGGETHHFIGSRSAEISLVTSEQELDFAQVTIHCKGVKPVRSHVKAVFPALKIVVALKFIKCKTAVTVLNNKSIAASRATLSEPLEIEYTANGEPNATILNSKADTFTFGGAMEGCTITFSPAPAPAATEQAIYRNDEVRAKNTKYFPTGIQEVVAIENTFERINYTIGGGACDELKKSEGKEGEYFGTLLTGLKTGDLSWE